jgi:hypothetical protein
VRSPTGPVTAGDLAAAVAGCVAALRAGVEADWSVRAGGWEWSCRDTAEHLADDLFYYAAQLGSGIDDHPLPLADAAAYPGGSVGSIRAAPDAGPDGLVEIVAACGALLVASVRVAEPGRRGFHVFGPADAEASAAMGILETVVHTHDITHGLDLPYRPDAGACARVLARLMPAVDPGDDPWEALLRATGRRGDTGSWRWWNDRAS